MLYDSLLSLLARFTKPTVFRCVSLARGCIIVFVLSSQFALAQEVWTDGDIGTVGLAGTGSYNSSTDTFTIAGAGAGVGGNADACNLISVSTNGNLELVAHVGSLQNISNYSTAGLMMRESTAAGAVSAYVAVSPGNGVSFITRSATNAQSVTALGGLGATITAPVWLRLVRSATTVTQNGTVQSGYWTLAGYYSTDGTNWIPIGSQAIQMANNVLLGIAVSSNTTIQTAQAGLDHVDLMTNVPQRSANLVAWYRADAGAIQTAGAVSQWQDQSGNGNNLSQSTGTNQPSFVANTINGQPVLHLTQANNSFLSVSDNSTLDPSQITSFIVTRSTGSGTGRILDKYSGTSGYSVRFAGVTSPTAYINASTASGSLVSNTWGLLETKYAPNTVSLYVNEALTTNTVSGTLTANTSSLTIGASSSGNTPDADVAEVLIFNTALSDSARQNVEAYLYQKYNVGFQPVAPTPTFSVTPGFYVTTQTVTLTGASGESLYYTTDGSTPTTGSTPYVGGITVSSTQTIKVLATEGGYANSSIASATYTIDTSATFSQSNLVAWYRADQCTAVSGSVSSWPDLSGKNNNLTQVNTPTQPVQNTNVLNGQPALHFSHSSNSFMWTPDSATLDPSQITYFVVTRSTSSGTGRLLDKYNSPNGYSLRLSSVTNPTTYINASTTSGSLASNTWGLLETKYDQSNVSFYVNGSLTTTALTGTLTATTSSLTLGYSTSGNTPDADVAEVLIFNTALTDAVRHNVEAYLYLRYGVGTSPPAPTPTFSVTPGLVYSSTQTVTLAGQTGEAFYYTTDGSTPTTGSTPYVGGITVSSTQTIKAIGAQSGYTTSAIAAGTYIIDTSANFSQSNLVAWYRADQCTAVSGSVSSWPDLSGKNNNLTQVNGSTQPAQNTNVLNGQPVLHFSHSSNSFMWAPDSTTLDPSQITYFVVTRSTSSGTGRILDKYNSPNGYSLRLNSVTSPTTYINASTTGGSLASNTWGLLETKYDQSNVSFYVNGTLATTALTGALTATTSSLTVGYSTSGATPDADVAEVLIFNTALSDTVRQSVEAYLYQRYGVGVQPPSGTPAFSGNPSSTVYSSTQTVTLSGQPGESFYYTTNGTTPTTGSTPYAGGITVSSTETIKVIGAQAGYANSTVASATYTIDPTANFSQSNLVAWYRADMCTPVSGNVGSWPDLSGNSNNLSQVGGSGQPVQNTNILNGQPVLHFSNSLNTALSAANSASLNPSQITSFVITRSTGSGTGRILDKYSGTSGYSLRFGSVTTPTTYINASTATGTLTSNTWGLLETKYDQSNISLYVNGTLTTTSLTAALASTTSPLTIGSSSAGNTPDADIAEVLIFNTALSDTVRHSVELYLYQRYGVGPQPPAATPTFNIPTGFYGGTQTITLTGPAGEAFYYTTNGTTPTTSSTSYTGSITVSSTETIKAIGTQSGYANSSIGSATYTIDATANFSQSNLVAWYRADQCSPVGGAVSSWPDLSGKNNTLSQTSSSLQPVQNTNILNGQPVLHFSHSSNTLLSAPDNSTLDPNSITYFLVMRTTGSGTGRMFDKYNSPYGYSLRFNSSTTPTTYINGSTTNGSLATNTWAVMETKYDQANISLYVNGTLTTTAQTGTLVATTTPLSLGYATSGNTPDADVAEVLIFNTALTDTVRHNVEGYLYQRYGVGTQPPAATPTFSVAPGLYSSTQTVTLAGQTGESFYYTTDGSTPTTGSNPYVGGITVSSSETIKAIGTVSGYATSTVGSAAYVFDATANFARSNLVAWYRADICSPVSGAVGSWPDLSGNNNTMSQSSSSLQPVQNTNVVNGQPVLHFSHSSNTLMTVPDNSTLDPSSITYFMVMRTTGSGTGRMLDKYNSPYGYSFRFNSITSPTTYINASTTSGTLASNTWGLLETKYDQTNVSFYVNGTLTSNGVTGTLTATTTPLSLGYATGGNTPDADVAEVLIFNTGLKDEDRLAVENYLAERYNFFIPTLNAPTFSVAGGTLSAPQQIALTAPTGATIYFTLDGSTPTTSSPSYTGPIYVDYTETIKAIAYENGLPISTVSSATYTLNSTLYPAPTTGNPTPPTITLQLPTNATLLP